MGFMAATAINIREKNCLPKLPAEKNYILNPTFILALKDLNNLNFLKLSFGSTQM